MGLYRDGIHHAWKQGNPLSNTIKDTSKIMSNPLPELCREGLRMNVLVSLLVLLSMGGRLVSKLHYKLRSIGLYILSVFRYTFHSGMQVAFRFFSFR